MENISKDISTESDDFKNKEFVLEAPALDYSLLCDLHHASHAIVFSDDYGELGRYCFKCFTDFLSKNLKNYTKETK